jgi:hypothetical protein
MHMCSIVINSFLAVTVGKIKLVLDELLDLKERNKQFLELEHITLNVQGTVFLLNKLFLS